MKGLLPLTLALAWCAPAMSAETYIVKLKQKNAKSLSTLKAFGSVETLDIGPSQFAFVKSEQKNALQMLQSDPNVAYVEPNFTYQINPQHGSKSVYSFDANDELFDQQWGLKNNGRNSSGTFGRGKEGFDINAQKAWEVSTGDQDVVIAVIDTGIDYKHQDLKNNMLANEAELNGKAGVDDDNNGYVDDVYGMDFANNDGDPMDDHGHGSHCAGVIGASHNDAGIRGVMANVKLVGVKFLTAQGSGTLDAAMKSIAYATKRGVNIMSNSWGGGGKSQALEDAIKAASEAGIVFVAAAGNENNDNDKKPSYPASYQVENVISVGAMDGRGERAYFSNYGKTSVHVFAPGVDIISTVTNNGYKKFSGTSMATPHVSGAIGLLLSLESNLKVSEIRTRLMETAIKSKELSRYTISGRMDALRLLNNTRE